MIKKIGLTILVFFAVGLIFRDFIIKQVIVSIGSSLMGAPVKVGGFSLSLLTRRVQIMGLENLIDF